MTEKTVIDREELIKSVGIGEWIHINSEDGQLKYRASIVGYSQGVLLTALPSAKQLELENVDYQSLFDQPAPLVMRLVFEGVIYAFKSEVLLVNTDACKLLLSAIPEQIQLRRLRQGVRYPCVLQAGLLIGEAKIRGVLTNISEGGCLLRIKAATKRDTIKGLIDNEKATGLDVRFPFEEKDSSFNVMVKSVAADGGDYLLLGLSYVEAGEAAPAITKYLEFMQLEQLSEHLVLS